MLKIDSKMEWTEALIGEVYQEIETIAKEELNLDPQKDLYTNQIEIVSAEQMLDAYTSIGLPVHYSHWSFGKDFVKNQNAYAKGEQNLAYELIINSNPSIALLMEENSMLEQTMVIAHACVSGDTEYLAPTGWRRIDQYDGGLVGQFNSETMNPEFVQPIRFINRKQTEFFKFSSNPKFGGQRFHQVVTPDHDMVIGVKVNGSQELTTKKVKATELIEMFNIFGDNSAFVIVLGDDDKLQFQKQQIEYEQINDAYGLAYCFTVPSGMLVIRHNGCVSVTGNCIGHNSVFANNVYFKTWTDATSIIDYMVFAREYIRTCEERYGYDEVEKVIDACHAIQTHGVDKYKRKNKSAFSDDGILQELITADEQRQKELDIILQKTTHHVEDRKDESQDEEEENLLYFIMKKSPNLARWKRELVRIIYKINQYFYPQTMCQTVHEGMATFCHHYIMTRLEEKGILTPDAYLAFLKSHSGVVYQPEYDKKWYSGPNPYALGYNIFRDLKRMCEEPTDEDREWFPNIVGKDWREVIKDAAFNYRDDSFINQFLSPKVIRDMKLFSVAIDYPVRVKDKTKALVSEIHDDVGYRSIRSQLAESKQRVNRTPQISIIGCDLDGDRVLKLKYSTYQDREIDIADAKMVMEHMDYLWGYPVSLKTKD